jgi:hypothetical protein
MPLTQLEQRLRDVARGRIARGELPCVAPPLRMWGGYGQGEGCVLCDTMIKPSEVALEVEESIEEKLGCCGFTSCVNRYGNLNAPALSI